MPQLRGNEPILGLNMVHEFFIWIGLHVETYGWMIGTCYGGLGIHVWDSSFCGIGA